MAPVLELRRITKRFPGVLANDHIDLTLEKGEIHALLGENGAGETTLRNILYGLYQPDEGELFVRGKKIWEDLEMAVHPEAYISDLPVGVQQRVEIIKLLYREADILILDEPTAV